MTSTPRAQLCRRHLSPAVAGLLLVLTPVVLQATPADAATTCTIRGTSKADVLVGTKRDDVICGLGGADVLSGGGGNDRLVGGDGNDTLRGGGGQDQLVGGAGADLLQGGGGTDRLSGGTAGDTLDGNLGADTMIGGGGTDTVTYASRTSAVAVRLTGTAGSGVASEGDTIGTDVENALGGAGDDVLLGNASANRLAGGPGHDSVEGRGGPDTLVGDAGLAATSRVVTRQRSSRLVEVTDDVLAGGDDSDTLIGGSGADVLDGGGGSDTVSYADASGPVTADLDGLPGDGVAGEDDTIGSNVENLVGGSSADVLTGSAAANDLDGGAGTDELYGAAGADLVDAGSGTEELTDGGPGADQCVASDLLIEDVPNCEPQNGFGVYNRVSLDPPPAADAQTGAHNGSKVPLAAAALPTGETVVLVASASGDPSITKLDELGGIDTSFGTDGWVYGLPSLLGLDRGYPTTLQVLGDEIYVGFSFQDTYLAKLDSDGVLQTGFGGDGFISLRDALGEGACPVACGDYGYKVSAAGVSVGWNDFHPGGSPERTAGTLRFSVADGSVVQATTFEDGDVDGGLPSDILTVPGGASLSITRAGNIRRYQEDGTRDLAFAGDGLLEPDTALIGDGRTVPRPQLVISQDGFARVGLAGAPKDDGTGVPKLDETLPQRALVEQFALDGTPTPAYGDSWTQTSVELPAEDVACDTAAAGSQSISTSAMDPLVSRSVVPIRRCSDAIWVALDPAGGGTVIRRTGPNQPRDTDSVAVPGGTLLVYASARDIVSVELVEGDLVDLAVVPRKPSLTVAEGLSASQGVRLTSKPSAPVTVDVTSDDTNVASVSPATMTFTPDNWSTPQQVTVTAAPDVDLVDGATEVQLASAQAASSSFAVVVDDTDVQSISTSTSNVAVTEGASSALSVNLGRKPSSNVTVSIASSDAGAATAAPATLTFTPTNWNVAQTVNLSGVQDIDLAGESVTVTLTAPDVANKVVSVNVTDDDVQEIQVSPAALVVPEAGSQTFEVTLAFQPQSDVSVSVESGDPDAATAGPTSLTFTSASWNTPQVVTVSGVDDADALNESSNVDLTSPGVSSASVAVQVVDDEAP